jgi:hypothetical protein
LGRMPARIGSIASVRPSFPVDAFVADALDG